jgi:putative aminopeptidase FrvX
VSAARIADPTAFAFGTFELAITLSVSRSVRPVEALVPWPQAAMTTREQQTRVRRMQSPLNRMVKDSLQAPMGIGGLVGVLSLAIAGSLHSQERVPAALAERLAGMSAVTGYEQAMVDSLLRLLPGARRDRAGNAVVVLGSGEPRRLFACPLDEPGYVVGGIRDDGWLTLRRVGPAPSPLFDQQLEGERVTVFGVVGPVPGVVAVRSTHLARGRSSTEEPFSIDQAYLDVGASSPAEVERLGVTVLSPVTLAKRPHRYGQGLLAAPVASRRGACAALAAATLALSPGGAAPGQTVIAFSVESRITRRGILTLGNTLGPFAETIIVDGGDEELGQVAEAADTTLGSDRFGHALRWTLPRRYGGSPVETIALQDITNLEHRLIQRLGGTP